MFFIKKSIAFFLSPLAIGFALGVIGFYFLLKQNHKKAKLFFILTFSWIFFISYEPISTTLLKSLENDYPKLEIIPKDVTHILALGGDSLARSYEVLRLYHKNKNLKIITSGYEPQKINGAVNTSRLIIESGLPKELITIKEKPRDTVEEALMIKSIVGDKPFILVTAAYHMPRSMSLFKKMGLHPIAAPTDFTIRQIDWLKILNPDALEEFDTALHEYIGLVWYALKGYI